MSAYSVLPLSSFSLELIPGLPTPALDDEFPVSIRLTMAAIDPNDAVDDEKSPSTLKIIKRAFDYDDEDIYISEDDEDEDDEEEDDEEEEVKKVLKQLKENKKSKKDDDEEMKDDEEEEDDEEDDEDISDDSDDEDQDVAEYVICTLSPSSQYQQTLDLVITSGEEVLFVVEGSYPIHLTGNYIEHPYDGDSDDYDEDDEDDEDFDSEDYDLSPDEDELDEDKIRELIDSDSDEEEEAPAPAPAPVATPAKSKKEQKKENKKRAAAAEEEESAASKKQKKVDAKKVAFSKELEQGPTGSTSATASTTSKKPTTKKLDGGVTVEDRVVGEGPTAKSGQTVGIRYIGKLADGKVFDSNTKGKPFSFKLGAGDVIKGMDIGVTGMSVKGERRVVIPAALAYGKKKLPGIPANSELTFDIKVVKIK